MTDIKELKEEEFEKVVGGQLEIGTSFGVSSSWPSFYQGEWFANSYEPEYIYTVFSSGEYNESFIANRYWYNNGEAWPYGTCSFAVPKTDFLHVVAAPKIIHKDFTGTKPF